MPTAYLSLGSNLGDRAASLQVALDALGRGDARVTAVSSLYETAPVGETATPVPAYLNLVARVETDQSPEGLLDLIQRIEQDGGRIRSYQWAPRTIDVDILLYDCVERNTDRLTIPHPRMFERAFVLVPLAEIAPDLRFPDGSTIGERLTDPVVQAQEIQIVSGSR